MFFERKVFIEFLSRDKIRLTTPFLQKEFYVLNHTFIDLIALKTINKANDFYLYVEENILKIYCHRIQLIESVVFEDKQKNIKVKILEI